MNVHQNLHFRKKLPKSSSQINRENIYNFVAKFVFAERGETISGWASSSKTQIIQIHCIKGTTNNKIGNANELF